MTSGLIVCLGLVFLIKKGQLPNSAEVPWGAAADLGHCRIFFLFEGNTVISVFHNTNSCY